MTLTGIPMSEKRISGVWAAVIAACSSAVAITVGTYARSYFVRDQDPLEAEFDVVRYIGAVPRDFYTPMSFVESNVKGKRVVVVSEADDGNERSRSICPFWRRAEEHWLESP
jgi:hypothetical protein